MRRSALAVLWVLAATAAPTGCGSDDDPRRSTLESSARQLDAAERSGHPTEILVVDAEIDAREAIARREPLDPSTTYLVLTRSEARIVWSRPLADAPPALERAIVGKWVSPFVQAEDLDGALKAFVFGYLQALHDADLLEWDEAIVPFLPPGPAHRREAPEGIVLALLIAVLVGRASATLEQ
jgi:hypothetical protein